MGPTLHAVLAIIVEGARVVTSVVCVGVSTDHRKGSAATILTVIICGMLPLHLVLAKIYSVIAVTVGVILSEIAHLFLLLLPLDRVDIRTITPSV
jgi:hypothetical protein